MVAQGLSHKQIAYRLKISRQAVSKLIRKALNHMGGCPPKTRRGLRPPRQPPKPPFVTGPVTWRYHGIYLTARPYYFYPKYMNKIKTTTYVPLQDWVVVLHRARLADGVYRGIVEFRQRSAAKDRFQGKDVYEALEKASASFQKALAEAGHRYGFEVEKNKKGNIEVVREHLAYVESGVARSVDSHILVRGDNDKVWFVMDKSRAYEHEYIEAGSVLDDQSVIEPRINDWRNHPAMPQQSELAELLRQTIGLQKESANLHRESASGLQAVIKLLKPSDHPPNGDAEEADYIG